MVVLGEVAGSYERGAPVTQVLKIIKRSKLCGQSIIGYLQKKGFPEVSAPPTLPWREAGPPNHHDDKVDSDL